MPDLPGRPGPLEGLQHSGRNHGPGFVPPATPTSSPLLLAQGPGDHPVEEPLALLVVAADQRPGLVAPGRALVCRGIRLVLGRPGLEVGLLREREGLDRGRGAPVLGEEPRGEPALALFDGPPPGRPGLEQPEVDALNLAHRATSPRGVAVDEPHVEPVDELGLEPGVVVLRGHHLGLEEHPPVEGQPASPLAGEGLDLVRDDEVGVQVGVAGAGVAVVERRGDQPGHRYLPYAARPDPGERDLALEQGDGAAHGRLVGGGDLPGDLGRGDRPQRRDGLHRGEGQVVAGDGGLFRS